MKQPKDIPQPVKWSTDFGTIDIDGQLEMCREDIGTDREWQPITIHDEDGPAEVVALCHPINARLVAAAPELLRALRQILAIAESGVVLRHETGKPTWSAGDETAKIARAAIATSK